MLQEILQKVHAFRRFFSGFFDNRISSDFKCPVAKVQGIKNGPGKQCWGAQQWGVVHGRAHRLSYLF